MTHTVLQHIVTLFRLNDEMDSLLNYNLQNAFARLFKDSLQMLAYSIWTHRCPSLENKGLYHSNTFHKVFTLCIKQAVHYSHKPCSICQTDSTSVIAHLFAICLSERQNSEI